MIKCFFIVPIGVFDCALTGYCENGHRAELDHGRLRERPEFPDTWPGAACATCGGRISVSSQSWNTVYRRQETGEIVGGKDRLPIGAVWEYGWRNGPDGRPLNVMTPGGAWFIDGRASNCTRPDDNEHRCWVRHGRPEDGTLHVDKSGNTCSAGAGSIIKGDYHGFLHHGHLRPA